MNNILSDINSNFNKLNSICNKNKYPFNLIDNINNVITTWNEVELEYINDFKIYKDTNKIKNKEGGYENKKNKIYIFI
jgi:hypothetical protein